MSDVKNEYDVKDEYNEYEAEGARSADDAYPSQTTDVADPAADPYATADPSVTGYFPPVREPIAEEPHAEHPYAEEPHPREPIAQQPDAELTAVPSATTDRFARMQEIQLAFIDDPRQAALDAESLLADVLKSFAEAVIQQRDALQSSPADGAPDTEQMRLAVRRSRQLIGALANVD